MANDNIFDDEVSAQRYADKHQKMAEKFGAEYTRKLKAREFSGGKILDVGCGFGGTLLTVLKNFPGAEGVGIDMSDPLLELARETAVAQGLEERVIFEKADAQDIPYADDSFDVAISTNVLHHVADPMAMLNEIARVLAPDGMLYIADIRRNRVAGLFDKAFLETMSYNQVLGLLYKAGWSDEWFTNRAALVALRAVSVAQAYLDKLTGLMNEIAPCLSATADLTIKHFFSGAAVYADGRICISYTPAGLALKLPEAARSELMKEEGAKKLQYFPEAPVKKAYVVLPQRMLDDEETLCLWVNKSIEYVLALP